MSYYAASSGNLLTTFRDKLSVSSSRLTNSKGFGYLDSWILRMGTIGFTETSVINYHYSLRNDPEERSSQLHSGGSLNSRTCVYFWLVTNIELFESPDLNPLGFCLLRWRNREVYKRIYRVSQEEWTKLRESVSYVKIYRYKPKHLYPKLNGYGDNGQRSLKVWQLLHTSWLPNSY